MSLLSLENKVNSIPQSEAGYNAFSDREREVLQLISFGLKNAAIANELDITETTVDLHTETLYRKLHVQNEGKDPRISAVIQGLAEEIIFEPTVKDLHDAYFQYHGPGTTPHFLSLSEMEWEIIGKMASGIPEERIEKELNIEHKRFKRKQHKLREKLGLEGHHSKLNRDVWSVMYLRGLGLLNPVTAEPALNRHNWFDDISEVVEERYSPNRALAILQYYARDIDLKTTSSALNIQNATTVHHIKKLYDKLNSRSRGELIKKAENRGLLEYGHLVVDALSKSELSVLELIVRGKSNNEISEELIISENTVKSHAASIYEKFHISERFSTPTAQKASLLALGVGIVDSPSPAEYSELRDMWEPVIEIDYFTEREREIMFLIQTLSGPEISEELEISTNTVKTHLKNLYEKFYVEGVPNNRRAVAVYAHVRGWMPNALLPKPEEIMMLY